MTENGRQRKKSEPPKDDPLLRSKRGIIDKIIGSEGQKLAEKRLAAIKRAREMAAASESSEPEDSTASSDESSSSSTPTSQSSSRMNKWKQLGPTVIPNGQTYSDKRVNVTGRITNIVIHPKNSSTIYVGAAQGGIWKTTDGGNRWVPTSDNALSLAIGALAIDTSNPEVLYAGTGEGNFAGDSQYGLGIIKTTNGGQTWESKGMNTFISSRFCRIAVNPKNSNHIFAATTSPASGIYRSTDAGEGWSRLTSGLPSSDATDIVLDPSNPDTAYAAFWGVGIFKTTNANATNPTWSKLTGGLAAGNLTRIVLGISQSSPSTLYALMADDNYQINMFYHTSDAGNTWTQIQLLNADLGQQGFYDINLAVHPQNENIVYLSGISLWKAIRNTSTNNWKFSDIGKEFHPDNHAFAFDPVNPEIIYAGSDGGIYKSINGGNKWDDSINHGLCITQFEFMEQDPKNEKRIIAGTQDNGTERYDGNSEFYHADDGDGGFVCIDPNQPQNVWHTYYSLSPVFSSQGGDFQSWQSLDGSISGNPSNFYPPMALDRSNSNNIAIGGQILYLDHSKGTGGWPDRIDLNLSQSDLISAINFVNTKIIYVGTNQGSVYRVARTGNNWTVHAIHASPFPTDRYIWDIGTLPDDETKIIVVVSGFGTPHVFHGDLSPHNNSATWTDISGTGSGRLPDIPVNALVIDENKATTMYVGTDVGVFRTVDGGNKWIWFSEGLPNCQVYDLRLNNPKGLLRAATHGRGMWERKVKGV
jgi:photosystem II stability/assembly factor-like uncharacterized protein